MFRSTFLPRALGVLSAAGGLGWLIYLYEPLARRLESYIVGVGLIGAVVTVLWFLEGCERTAVAGAGQRSDRLHLAMKSHKEDIT